MGNRESVMNPGRGERTSSFLTESKTRKSDRLSYFFLDVAEFRVIDCSINARHLSVT